ncbi:TPA: ATP-binding protein, partial [Morganella morganii]|nr:ATP-binding protein [Morganella morganii]
MKRDIEFFLKEKFNSGMLILGDWGIGKTYATKKLVNDILKENKYYKYISYVPMNGMTNINQLEEVIYKNKRDVANDFMATFRNILKEKVDIKRYRELYKLYIMNDVSNTLIIIDDIERALFDNKQDEDLKLHFFHLVLGLLNRMTQENNSKFIIIMNKDEIKNVNSVINEFSEKYLSTIIDFKQSDIPFDIAMSMLEESEDNREIFSSSKEELNLALKYIKSSNIRVIYKSLRSYLNILKLKLNDGLKKDDIRQEINELIKDYYLFICILNALPIVEKSVTIGEDFMSKAGDILNSYGRGKVDVNLQEICKKITNNKIFKSNGGLFIPKLSELIYAKDHELIKLKNIISDYVSGVIKNLSDEGVRDLVVKIKTTLNMVTKSDLSCIKNDSVISIGDLVTLIYYIDDNEKLSILIEKLDYEIENIIQLGRKWELQGLNNLIGSSYLIKISEKKIELDPSEGRKLEILINANEKISSKLNEILEIEKSNEENKKKIPPTNDETIEFFKLILALMSNEIECVNEFSDGSITLNLKGD